MITQLESYLLAWYFAGNHVKTDAFNKRNKKGYVFTIGDEPTLKSLPINAVKELLKESAIGQQSYTADDLLKKAQEQNFVYHIHIDHGYQGTSNSIINNWKPIIGQNLIVIKDYRDLAKTISNIIISNEEVYNTSTVLMETISSSTSTTNKSESKEEIYL